MRYKQLIFLALMIVALLPSQTLAAQYEIIVNGGFETQGSSSTDAYYWTQSSGAVRTGGGCQYDGYYCMKFTAFDESIRQYTATFTQSTFVSLTFVARTSHPNPWYNEALFIWFMDNDALRCADLVYLTNLYTSYSIGLCTSATVNNVLIKVALYTKGYGYYDWLDSVSLKLELGGPYNGPATP